MSERPGFGDHVRIQHAPETEERGFAGREGDVHGESIPSASGVGPVIGDRGDDHALSVYFDDTGEQEWFAPHLVQFVSRPPEETFPDSYDVLRTFMRRGPLPFKIPDPTGRIRRWLEGRASEPR